MYNELSAALLLVHYAKSSLIKDRIPSRAQRTILPPHCYPFLFDGNLRSGVIYLFIFFLLLSFFGSRENGAETPIWALIRWLKLLFEETFAPGKRKCLWLHSMKFYCVQEAKFVPVNLKTFAFATMLLILATRKALFYKALFSCTLPHKFQQVQRRRPRLLIRKNCCSEWLRELKFDSTFCCRAVVVTRYMLSSGVVVGGTLLNFSCILVSEQTCDKIYKKNSLV